MSFRLASALASFLLVIILAAGSFWIYDVMVGQGFTAWWQWTLPIAFTGLCFVAVLRAIWS